MSKYYIILLIGLIGCGGRAIVEKQNSSTSSSSGEKFSNCEPQECAEDTECQVDKHLGCVQSHCNDGICEARYIIDRSINDPCYEYPPGQSFPETCEIKWCSSLEDCPTVPCKKAEACLDTGTCLYLRKGFCP